MKQSTITLDVREDIRNGHDPFTKISATMAKLEADQDLLLIAPFEPVPLFFVLAKKGFTHKAEKNAGGDWEVLFSRNSEKAAAIEPTPVSCGCGCSETNEITKLDARGLEPPQPMVNILEALMSLPANSQLKAHTDRRPIHLYPMLKERGFTAQTEEQSDGSFITSIRHN